MKRPIAITLISWLFIVAGGVGFIYHLREINPGAPFSNDAVWIELVRLLAIVGGVLTLRGSNLGRWLLMGWITYHVVVSYFHPLSELVVHLLFMALTAFALFLPRWAVYFRRIQS